MHAAFGAIANAVAESSDVRAVFFFNEKKVAVVSLGVDLDPFLERVRACEAIPIPNAIGVRATHLRLESGTARLYVMTVDHLTDAAGKLYDVCFDPARIEAFAYPRKDGA
jgi:hypothetical protein